MNLHSFFAKMVSQPRSWFRALTERDRLEAEMEAELALHIESLAVDLERKGYAPEDALRRARIAVGTTTTHKEGMRASLGLRWWDELRGDLRYAARKLRKSPGFTLVSTLSLAMAIGANTTIFSVAKQLLYERLDVPHAADLRLLAWTGTVQHVVVHSINGDYDKLPGGMVTSTAFGYPVYQQLRAQNSVLGDLFAFKYTDMNATINGQPQRIEAEMVSGNYYEQMGVRPQLGRAIQPSDDAEPGRGPVAVISDGVWRREFGASPTVIGQTIKVNDAVLTIVGVNPREFTGAQAVQESPAVFVPLSMQPLLMPHGKTGSMLVDSTRWWVNVMGRARPGVTDEAAQTALATQLNAIVRATMRIRPGEDLPQLKLRDGSRGLGLFVTEQRWGKPMAVLMALVGLVLLLACANIANLMLARGAQRQREMSVRLALGAGRMRILRQMMVESLLLAAVGGAAGLALGYFGATAAPGIMDRALSLHFDWGVFAFTAAITILTGLLFGMAPALAASRAEVTHGLKEAAQTTTRRRKGMSGKALVGFQVALSTLLVIGAGLFLRTLASLNHVDVGFRTDHLLLVEITPPTKIYPAGKDVELHRQLEQAFAAMPGVDSVAVSFGAYLSGENDQTDFKVQGAPENSEHGDSQYYNAVGVHFFETMGIPILAGRAFNEQDTANSPRVGIINQALARARFGGQNPIGKLFQTNTHNSDGHKSAMGDDWIRIVGVCADTRYSDLRAEPPPQFFLPFVQESEIGGMAYQIRTRMAPAALLPELRRTVQHFDPDLPLVNVRTQDEQIAEDLTQERLFVTLTSGFGVLALALACVGIYGIMAYSVANRRNEIGIRMALGAQPGQVRRMVLGESTWLAGAGIAAGLAIAMLLARLVKSMLYGIEPWDPATLLGGVGLLLFVALASGWIPARRAARVQPMEALRHE